MKTQVETNVICPICKEHFKKVNNSLVCTNKHTFDIAKSGYVNFLSQKSGGIYNDKEIFAARRKVYKNHFFDPIIETVENKIRIFGKRNALVLEVGCGEGSLLSAIIEKNVWNCGIGVDISKTAINKAAKLNKDIAWVVADLCDLPMENHSVDIIIDMLTPSNYTEFLRVLKNDGILIKVFPNIGHLCEIKEFLNIPINKKGSVNDYLMRDFEIMDSVAVKYKFSANNEILEDIFQMTPLTSNRNYSLANAKIEEITVDLTVAVSSKVYDG